MSILRGSKRLVFLSILFVTLAPGILAAAPGLGQLIAERQSDRTTIKWPSPEFRTLQTAIEAAPDGATILVRPGIYEESLRIEGKRLKIIGSDEGRSVLVSRSLEAGILTYADNGGGELKDIHFVGGAYGVAGERGGRGLLPSTVALKKVSIAGSFRGISGAFSALSLKDVQIASTIWHGISLLHVETFVSLSNVEVLNAGGVGLWVDNNSPGDKSISGHYHHNAIGGVVVVGHNGNVAFFLTVADHNGVYGIGLWDVHAGIGLSDIRDHRHPTTSGCSGAGLGLLDGSIVTIGGTLLQDNCIAFGASGGGSMQLVNTVTINSTTGDSEALVISGPVSPPSLLVCGFDVGTPSEVLVNCGNWASQNWDELLLPHD